MTTITAYPLPRRSLAAQFQPLARSLASLPVAFHQLGARWRSYRQQRALEALPEGLMKDIGWPAPHDGR